ncbi:hypothetical protein FOMPIDRAFT_158377 [Fomitopsis schrenkii]|uniref:DUF6533 domain-containing protein n=1 Tax=Fomitopsis schrenkii TaxID=2126942 RepID=S8EKQ9_FOMSC|nr:hypothetical protein FOMPIDRAFT_158377 [Fomitopsis schrenkii]
MSSLSAAELAELAKESFTENCCASAAVALLIYDWVITLGQETRYVWHSKFRGYTALFFLNRINMAGMIIGILLGLTPWHTGESCESAVLVLASFQIMNFFIWAIVSSLRVYAISNRGLGFALVTLALGLVPVGTNLFNFIESSYFVNTYSIFVECQYSQKFSDAVGFRLLILTRVSVIVADAVVLLVSWRHLHGTLKSSHVGVNRSSLGVLLLRDGTLYFLILLLLNIAQIIAVLDFGQNLDPIPDFIFPLTLVIISRFILNLRRFSQQTGDPLESESWATGPEDSHHSAPRSYLSNILFRSSGRADQSDRTANSLHDGIMVKVSTYSDANGLRDVESDVDDHDGEAIALQHVRFDTAHRRHSELPSYKHQSFDPLDYGIVQKGEAC